MIQRMFVTLDTKKTNYKNVGKINHGDDLFLELTVLSDGDMISFNDPMVDLLVKKSDGKMIRQNSGIEYIQPNKFIIEVKKDCVTSPGLATNQLIINDNGRISTCMFYYTILNSLEEDVIQSISSVEVLEQLDEYVIEARERMELLNNGIKELEELFGATSDNLVEAEMARNEAEQIRVQSETLRVNNEKDRIEADHIRNQNEVDRSSSELVREERESERILNEEERHQNESERMIDESTRQQNENARQSNESIRMSNENDRKTQENRRVTAETNRVNAETIRRNNENSRISNESERQKTMNEMKSLIDEVEQNENARQSNESVRISNENDRKAQENGRATAETNRVNAETTRRNNENSRISNETERQKAMNEMKSLIGNVNDFDERVGVIEDEIEGINSSLDNTTKEVVKKADKEYVDLQDRDLLRQIGQGVTDEQLKNAVQSKIDDGSIALSVGENSITPMNLNNGVKSVEPLIWSIKDDSVIKDLDTITIGTNVGVIYRDTFIYVANGSYTFDSTDKYLVLRDVTLGNGGTATPVIVSRRSLNENDIILAYKSKQIRSIWDSIIVDYVSNINKNILATPFSTSRRTPLGGFATITSRSPFNIDTENKTITFDGAFINYNGKFIKLSSNNVDITNALKGGWIWYDVDNNTVVDTKPSSGENYIYLGTLWIDPIVVNINNECGFTLNGLPYNYQNNRWTNKIINCLGDSITKGNGCTKPYHKWLSQLCGFKTIRNYGVGGSTISRKTGDLPAWDNAVPFIDRYSTMDDNADVILIFGGVNDWVAGRELGEIGDTADTTFYGALKILLEGLKTKYPNKEICFISPIQNNYRLRPPYGGNKDGTNIKGKTLLDYINAIKEMCEIYSIPFKDMYHNCFYGLSETENSIFMPDYLHPNDDGHKKMACKIGNFLNSL